jgi:hypothetical protein
LERAATLRDKAARCRRLSQSINDPGDAAWLEALALAAIQDADRIEAEENVGAAVGGDVGERTKCNIAGELEATPDRRRPERCAEVNPVLIPLLREEFNTSHPGDLATDGDDQLSASRGVIIWALISAALFLLALLIFGWSYKRHG